MNLGNILLAWGVVQASQLAAAVLEQSRQPGKRLGELIVAMGFATREQIDQCLAKQEALRSGHAPITDIETVAEYATETTRRMSGSLEELRGDIEQRTSKAKGRP